MYAIRSYYVAVNTVVHQTEVLRVGNGVAIDAIKGVVMDEVVIQRQIDIRRVGVGI